MAKKKLKTKDAMTAFLKAEWALGEQYLQQIILRMKEINADFTAFFDVGNKEQDILTISGNTARIDINGVLFKYSNILTFLGYGTSVEQIEAAFDAAMQNKKVKRIKAVFDTPGGQVAGISHLANKVYAARGKKELLAISNGMVTSAGYWLASAFDRIIATDRTDMFGSIGVVYTIEKTPDDEYVITNTTSKNKRPDPETEEGMKELTRLVDDIATVFEEDVAKYRGVSVDTVRKQYGNGSVFLAEEALERNMIDSIETIGGKMDIETLKVEHPDLVTAISAEAVEKVKEETKVLQEKLAAAEAKIEELTKPPADPLADVPEEIRKRLEASEAKIKELKERELRASLAVLGEDITNKLLAIHDEVEQEKFDAIVDAFKAMQEKFNKVAAPVGTEEIPAEDPEAEFDKKVEARAQELIAKGMSMTDAYIEANKQILAEV